MNARIKLNSSYLNGCLLFAALMGWLTNSFWMFVLTGLLLICSAIHASDIRLGTQMQPSGRGKVRR